MGRRSGFEFRQWWPHAWRPGLFVVALVLGLAVYWLLLHGSHMRMREQVRIDTQRLASQTAQALALQMDTVVRQLDYFSQHLGWIWLRGDPAAFHDASSVAIRTVTPNTLTQIAVADASGRIQYSNLNWGTPESAAQPAVSIADREHFRVHAQASEPFLFISDPIKGRISQQWTIQFTRGLWRDGQFVGVLVLAVSAEHLTTSLKAIFPDATDAAALLKNDGTYLARSYYLADVLRTKLPSSRPFIRHPEVDAGIYEVVGIVDPIARLYSWRRVDSYPLVILVGLGSEKAMSLIDASINDSMWHSGFGSALLLLIGLTVAFLWMQRSVRAMHLQRVADALQASEARLRVTLEAVRDGLWRYDHVKHRSQWDARIRGMLGYGDDYATLSVNDLIKLIHPQDLARLRTMRLSDSASGTVMNIELRLLKADGRWLWLRARGGVIERDPTGAPARSVGTLTDISEQVAEAHLRDALLNRSAAVILVASPDRKLVDANEQFSSLFLKPGQTLRTLRLRDIHIDQAQWDATAAAYTIVKAGGRYRAEHAFRDANGDIRWFETSAVLQNPDDPESNVIWTWIDITSRRQADAALAIETSRLTTLLECYPGGVLIKDAEDRIIFVNALWPVLMGLESQPSSLKGLRDSELRELMGPEMAAWLPPAGRGHAPGLRHTHDITTAQGRHLEIDHIDIQQGDRYLGSEWLVRDITDRKRHELNLAQLASTDTLTGMPNRRSFMQSLNTLYAEALHTETTAGVVMMLDIDRFKQINDTHGHAAGDIVLQHVARLIKESVRTTDIPGRFGGEEFVILQPYTSVPDGLATAERIRRKIEDTRIAANGREIRITISIGVSMVSAMQAPEAALHQADVALYTAKNSGRNLVRLCEGPEPRISG